MGRSGRPSGHGNIEPVWNHAANAISPRRHAPETTFFSFLAAAVARASTPLIAAIAGVLAPLTAAAVLLAPSAARAHEIPERVAIVAFVQPDSASATLRVLLRVPLEAMRDLDVPLTASGALDLVRIRALLPDAAALWVAGYLGVFEEGRRLPFGSTSDLTGRGADGSPVRVGRLAATRISLPSDRSFGSYATALAHMQGEGPPAATEIQWNQAMLDVLLEYPIGAATSRFAIEPALAHLGVRTTSVLRLQLPDGGERILVYEGNPGRVELDPGFGHAALRFVREGFVHILGGLDHLLFVLCLVLPVRRWRPLVTIVTAFTVAHSLTLGAAALGFTPGALWFPPLVEAAIALSIVYLAIENMLLSEERLEQRWMMAFGFGLIHGFGFSFALGEQLQFAGRHLLTSLAAFNVGVELGQLLVLALAVPVLIATRRYVRKTASAAGALGAPSPVVLRDSQPRATAVESPSRGAAAVTIVGSAIVAHTAWHWMSERFSALAEYRAGFVWPQLDAVFVLGALRAALLLAIAIAVGLGFQQILRMLQRPVRRTPVGDDHATPTQS